jgi:hypothetical protein
VAALGLCLTTWNEPARFFLAGALGLSALTVTIFRELAGRLLFGGSSLLLLALYAWAGSEALRLQVVVRNDRTTATVGEITVSAGLADASGGGVAIGITPSDRAPALEPRHDVPFIPSTSSTVSTGDRADAGQALSLSKDLAERLARGLSSNLAAGVRDLALLDLQGQPASGGLGPFTFWEPARGGGPPLTVDPEPDHEARGPYWLLSTAGPSDLHVSLDLINGGPPVDLLLRLDNRLNGVAVRAWPDRRELSIHEVRSGVLGRQLAGGYQTLRRPPLQGFQSLLREVLRAWLVGMALLATGALLLPISRLLPGPGQWWAPRALGPMGVSALVLGGFLVTAWIASDVLERIPHVQDSVAYLFQAKTFALGRLSAPLPPVPEAFEHEFIHLREAWHSKYPPGHPLLLALGVVAGFPWLVSPLAASLTILFHYLLGRSLFDHPTAILSAILLLVSPFFLFMSGSMMAHATSLLLATLGLYFVVRSAAADSFWLPVLAGLALGWLTASRQLTGLAIGLPAVAWLILRLLAAGRSLKPAALVALGWSWPLLILLAYNRALTGDPLLNPSELWWEFDRPGFGPSVGMHGGHDLGRGLWNTYANLTALEVHLFGWPTYVTLAFALLPFATGRARAGDWLCSIVSLSLAAGYVAYWADGIMFGPRYYYEIATCLALLTARGVMVAVEVTTGGLRSALRRRAPASSAAFYTLLVAGLIGGNLVVYLPEQVELHRGYNHVNGSRLAIVRQAGLHRALVFVPTSQPFAWWEYGSVFSANDPLLTADVIYARDLGPATNQRTAAAFPERTAYLLADDRLTPISDFGL